MPSPFPGMDPFIEGQRWQDFHATFITVARETLTPQLRPDYVVDVEEYVYVLRDETQRGMPIRPDVVVTEAEDRWARTRVSPSTVTVHYLAIRKRKQHQVVTVIELLSPWNKSPDGRVDSEIACRARTVDEGSARGITLGRRRSSPGDSSR